MSTEPRPLRFGYVGCGFMAQKVHLPNFSSIPGCELLALAEVRAGLRDRIAERYGIPRRYSSHEEMARDLLRAGKSAAAGDSDIARVWHRTWNDEPARHQVTRRTMAME